MRRVQNMGKAGGERGQSREEIELHVAGHHAAEALLYRCLLCQTAQNSLHAHFRTSHARTAPIKDINYLDIR